METTSRIVARVGAFLLAGSLPLALASCQSRPPAPPATPTVEASGVPIPRTVSKESEEPIPVITVPVTMQMVDHWIDVEGSLQAWRRARPAAEDAGRVVSMNFEVGESVKDGAILVQLDDTIQKLEVARDEAWVEAGRLASEERATELESAERELSRVQSASEAGEASEAELEAARMAAATVRSQVGQARAEQLGRESQLRASRKRLDRLAIKAPFAGVISGRSTEMGGWLDPGESVGEIVDMNSMEVRVLLPESVLFRVKENEARVRVMVPLAEMAAEVPIVRILRDIEPVGRTFVGWAKLDNKDGKLVPGLRVRCLVLAGDQVEAPTVPLEAMESSTGGDEFIYMVDDGRALPLQMGEWYVSGNLAVLGEGMRGCSRRVVVEGLEGLPKRIRPVVEREAAQDAELANPPVPKLDSRKPE